jgi:hypothetical protein
LPWPHGGIAKDAGFAEPAHRNCASPLSVQWLAGSESLGGGPRPFGPRDVARISGGRGWDWFALGRKVKCPFTAMDVSAAIQESGRHLADDRARLTGGIRVSTKLTVLLSRVASVIWRTLATRRHRRGRSVRRRPRHCARSCGRDLKRARNTIPVHPTLSCCGVGPGTPADPGTGCMVRRRRQAGSGADGFRRPSNGSSPKPSEPAAIISSRSSTTSSTCRGCAPAAGSQGSRETPGARLPSRGRDPAPAAGRRTACSSRSVK